MHFFCPPTTLLKWSFSPCSSQEWTLLYWSSAHLIECQECVLLNSHQVFADFYAFLFGRKAKLTKKPKPCRISLLLEVIYGGWTLIRDMILSVFCKCKDTEFLALLNLFDNYVQLVLSIYSILFKCNKYELFCQSLLYCWVVFTVFKRHHNNKVLLVMLSTFLHL